MSVLVYADCHKGKIRKTALEAASYGAAIALQTGTSATALVLGPIARDEMNRLGHCGITRVLNDPAELLSRFDSGVMSRIIRETVLKEKATVIVLAHNFHGRALAPRVAAGLQAGLVTGAVSLPETGTGFIVKKEVFSGKAFAYISIKSEIRVITLSQNIFPAGKSGPDAELESFSAGINQEDYHIEETLTETGKEVVSLAEAERIVSGGRGMKGPENWGMIEELARVLGAATACSRPVADSGWRPHQEHVGQTGLTVRPNLYLAIGISWAIQHLAGVSGSKVIVVINKDPEAPFFKAADYGIAGDAFRIVPALTEAVKKLNT